VNSARISSVWRVTRHAALLGFLREDLAHHRLFLDAGLEFGRGRLLAAARGLLHQHVDARLRHRFAVDDGDVLRVRSTGEGEGHGQRGEGLLQHG
jgi:hypothetical protein